MKLLTVAALAAAVFAATPAAAESNFTGARVEVTAGVDDVTKGLDTTDVTYGAAVGVDFAVVDNVIFGVEANLDNVFDRREVGASARLGYEVADNVLLYGKAGYTNYKDVLSRDLDGFRVGGGLEVNVSDQTFVKGEYRYSDLNAGVGRHQALVGLGIRF